MIKAFLFDWGGVMSRGGLGGELDERLVQKLGITPEEAHKIIEAGWTDFTKNIVDETGFWERAEKVHGKTIPVTARAIWNRWEHTSVLAEMQELVNDLQQAGYAVGLISNTIPPTAYDIRAHGGYDLFDFTILSFEVGCAKPEDMIYQLALDRLAPIQVGEVVFIDDQERCVDAARTLGMHTILAETPAQTIQAVRELTKI